MNHEIIKAATGQIQVVSHQELTQPVNSKDAAMLQKAITAPKIELIGYDDTKGLIKRCMIMVGLKATEIMAMDELEKQMMVDFLQRNFTTLKTDEFILAFELAILGKLSLKTEDVNCYQNFSIAYVSKILTAYREWANKTYNDNRHILEQPEQKALPVTCVDWKEYCELSYQQFKKGNYNTDTWAIESMYREFISVGYIAENLDLNYEAVAESFLLKKLENRLFDAKLRCNLNESKKISTLILEINESEETHEAVKIEAKTAVIIDFFNYAYNTLKLENIYKSK